MSNEKPNKRLPLWLHAVWCILGMIAAVAWKEASAQDVPANAKQYLPMLIEVQKSVWPAVPIPDHQAAQIEKESCITRRHPKCWNPHAELKTSREYGFGFGQTTIAYNADGSERFNVFKELKGLDPVLRQWEWNNRFDPYMQLRAFVVKNRIGYDRIIGAATELDRVSFSLAGYNGGISGVLSERRLCQATSGCDPNRWIDNVERTSNKSRIANHGYGKSAYQINREYPRDILYRIRPTYTKYFKE